MSYGLVRVIPGSDLGEEKTPDLEEVVVSQLTAHIRKHWEINKSAKLLVEEGMLEDLRAKKGQYSPQKLQQIRAQGGSEIYMMLTAVKQRAAANWIKDIILPADEKAWGISPTTIPSLPKWAEQAIAERMEERGITDQAEQQALRELVSTELNKQAKISAENMENKITDQLEECGWGQTIDDLIDDFTTFPVCILKGPVLKKRKTLKWESIFGSVKPQIGDELRLEFERVSPFDIYPSPESSGINDGNLIERIRFSRGELYSMIGVTGYKDSAIRGVLEQYPHGLRNWLWNDTERLENENKHRWWMSGDDTLIDGIHYWGSVQGSMLSEWGMTGIKDELAEYQIDAILIGNHVIRCTINNDPLARRPYHKACYDPIPGAFYGNSIRYLMNDIQEFCNASARALVNNMAMASGPMVEINYERLSPMEEELEIRPWKVIQTRGAEIGGGKSVQFFQPESNAAELMAVYDKFELKADDATTIPRYTYGNEKVGGAGQTMGGLSMLMNSAAKGIKAAIGNLDNGVVRPSVEMVYYYNMLTSNDPTIKGDAKVVARGANALLLRDMAQQKRTEFLSVTTNEIDMQIMGPEGRAKVLRSLAKDIDLPDIVPTTEALAAQLEEQAQNQPPDPAVVKANTDMEIAAIEKETDIAKAEIDERDRADQRRTKLEEIRMKNEAEREKAQKKYDSELALIASKENSEIRLMQEETARIIERHEINGDVELEKHEREMEMKERQHKELMDKQDKQNEKSAKETKESSSAVEKQEPMVLNVIIDSKSGKVKKSIQINRDKNKAVDTIDVEQTEE
jgi:hypothetical protein